MMLVTTNRLRMILAECRTNADVAETLRYHKVKFKYDTKPGYLSIVVPTATGSARITKTASKTAPFVIGSISPEPYSRPKHIRRCAE